MHIICSELWLELELLTIRAKINGLTNGKQYYNTLIISIESRRVRSL